MFNADGSCSFDRQSNMIDNILFGFNSLKRQRKIYKKKFIRITNLKKKLVILFRISLRKLKPEKIKAH